MAYIVKKDREIWKGSWWKVERLPLFIRSKDLHIFSYKRKTFLRCIRTRSFQIFQYVVCINIYIWGTTSSYMLLSFLNSFSFFSYIIQTEVEILHYFVWVISAGCVYKLDWSRFSSYSMQNVGLGQTHCPVFPQQSRYFWTGHGGGRNRFPELSIGTNYVIELAMSIFPHFLKHCIRKVSHNFLFTLQIDGDFALILILVLAIRTWK